MDVNEQWQDKVTGDLVEFLSYYSDWGVYIRCIRSNCNILMAKDLFLGKYEKYFSVKEGI